MRSRLSHLNRGSPVPGITSACAEQTAIRSPASSTPRDHLRVCGADHGTKSHDWHATGSPPRVRSRHSTSGKIIFSAGITSACAEQTGTRCRRPPPPRDHLRVCGADNLDVFDRLFVHGSPPRVRSRPSLRAVRRRSGRITSACAEQTPTLTGRPVWRRDHLRVCGADQVARISTRKALGSPPRVRSRRAEAERYGYRHGITSACAEQTLP